MHLEAAALTLLTLIKPEMVGSPVLLVSLMTNELHVGANRLLMVTSPPRAMLTWPLSATPNRVLVAVLQFGAEMVRVLRKLASLLTMENVLSSVLPLGARLLVRQCGVTCMTWRLVLPNLGEAVCPTPFMVMVKETSAGGMLRLLNELDTELPLLTVLVFRLIRVTSVLSMVVVGPF